MERLRTTKATQETTGGRPRPIGPRPRDRRFPPTADPQQSILSPSNVAVTSSIPLHLGGSVASAVVTADWGTPDGAILTRVSGHEIAFPLAVSQLHGPVSPAGRASMPVRRSSSACGTRRPAQAIGSQPSASTRSRRGARGASYGASRCRCESST